MDALASFLEHAHWSQVDENLYFCDDPKLETILVNATTELPGYLTGYGFQAWKVLSKTRIQATKGYIIPITTISGEPRLLSETSQPRLVSRIPVRFDKEPVIDPALSLILTLPPP